MIISPASLLMTVHSFEAPNDHDMTPLKARQHSNAMISGCAIVAPEPVTTSADGELEEYQAPLPLCADESCVHGGEVDEVVGRYQMINIKLDKSGLEASRRCEPGPSTVRPRLQQRARIYDCGAMNHQLCEAVPGTFNMFTA